MSGSAPPFIAGATHAGAICPDWNPRLGESAFVPFVSFSEKKRRDPKSVAGFAESAVVVCVPYEPSGLDNLSSLGTCGDYHPRVREALLRAAEALPPHRRRILVDSPFLCERSLAARAGLGFFGKNGLLLTREYGSFCNIGVMLTDIPYPVAAAIFARSPDGFAGCAGCAGCIKACPNGALAEGRPLDSARCISYLTQKKELATGEGALLRGQLYGCDICQRACPLNAGLAGRPFGRVDPAEWLGMTDEELCLRHAGTAMMWRGAGTLRRNALAAMGKPVAAV